jgi:hypothetical protein
VRKLVFLIRLPDPLPFTPGTTMTFSLDRVVPELDGVGLLIEEDGALLPGDARGNLFVSLKYWQVPAEEVDEGDWEAIDEVIRSIVPAEAHEELRPAAAVAEDSDEGLQHQGSAQTEADGLVSPYTTVVEAVTVLLEDDEDPLSEAFDRCLEKLAAVVRALRVASRLPLAPITQERLPFIVPFLTCDFESNGNWAQGLFLTHMNVPGPLLPPQLSPAQRADFQAQMTASAMHPLFAFAVRAAEAELAFERYGDMDIAVINAQVSAEVLLDTVLELLMREEGLAPDAAAEVFESGLVRRVRTQFPARLGGDWDTAGRGPVGSWISNLARLRGRVVHAAYEPTRTETQAALGALGGLEGFVKTRVAAQRFNYPKTALVVLGQTGLQRRGIWSTRFQAHLRGLAVDVDTILAEFAEWQRELEALRTA